MKEVKSGAQTNGLVKGSLSVFISLVAVRMLGVATSVILARALGPTDRGAFAVITLVPTLGALLGGLGIGLSNMYYASKRMDKLAQILSNSAVVASVSGGVLVLVLLALLGRLGDTMLRSTDPFYLRVAVCSVPFLILNGYLFSVLRGMNRIKEWNLLNVLQGGLWATVAAIALIVLAKGLGGAVVGSLFVTAVVTSALAARVFRGLPRRLALDLNLLRDQVTFGLKGYLANLFQFMNYRLDVFFVNYFAGPRQLGYYVVAVSTAEMVWYIGKSVETVFFPRVTTATLADADSLTPRVCSYVMAFSAVVTLGLFLFSRPIIGTLYGESYLPSLVPLLLLLPGVLVFAPSGVLTNYIVGTHGLPIVATCKTFVALLVTLVLDLALIPTLGTAGAAIATTCSYATNAVITMIVFFRLSNATIGDLFVTADDLKSIRRFVVNLFGARKTLG